MSSYQALARYYDALTGDVPYLEWAEYIEKLFKKHKTTPKSILDVACGTGTLAVILAQKGYEVVAVDASEDMLAAAALKCAGMWNAPLFINQSMTELDLYGTSDVALSCLDSINYLAGQGELMSAFERVSLFLNPGGLFIFDINTEYKLLTMHGTSYIREADGIFCAWQAEYSQKTRLAHFYIDLFEESGDKYVRYTERHTERAFDMLEIAEALSKAGMKLEKIYGERSLKAPKPDEERVFVVARKEK